MSFKLKLIKKEDLPKVAPIRRIRIKDGIRYDTWLWRQLRIEALGKLGNKCVKCGFSDIRALQIDHINGGGCYDMRNRSRKNLYRFILNNDVTGIFQLLCANCNWIKRYENDEIPYKVNRKIVNE